MACKVTPPKWRLGLLMVCLLSLLLASACSDDDSRCLNGTCDSTLPDSGPATDTAPKADSLPPWCSPSTPGISPPKCRNRPAGDGGVLPPADGAVDPCGLPPTKCGTLDCTKSSWVGGSNCQAFDCDDATFALSVCNKK